MIVELSPFRLWLEKEPTKDGWVSGWRADRTELVGGERAVFYWLHAMCGRSREDAVRLTRLYWRVRNALGCGPGQPFDMANVPADLRRDVAPHAWMFDALSDATWCVACRSCPQLADSTLCAWCRSAPIAELFP